MTNADAFRGPDPIAEKTAAPARACPQRAGRCSDFVGLLSAKSRVSKKERSLTQHHHW